MSHHEFAKFDPLVLAPLAERTVAGWTIHCATNSSFRPAKDESAMKGQGGERAGRAEVAALVILGLVVTTLVFQLVVGDW